MPSLQAFLTYNTPQTAASDNRCDQRPELMTEIPQKDSPLTSYKQGAQAPCLWESQPIWVALWF